MSLIYQYLFTFIIAFIVAFVATPLVRKFAFALKAIDVPKDSRRIHKKPIALLGGLAISAAFVISIIIMTIVSNIYNLVWFESNRLLIGLLAGVSLITFIGFVDDIRPMGAKTRLLFQIVAAIMVMLVADIRIERVTNPFAKVGVTELSPYISYPFTVFWVVGITNAFNLIDGLDGLAAGVSSIASLSLFLVAMLTPTVGPFAAVITAALTGATLGFLPFNFNPAKIFMGSTGAYFLGFTLAVASIEGMFKSYTAISIAVPLLVLGLPLFDTALAILRRIVNRKSVLSADRDHLHHKLIDLGLSHKQTVLVLYVASAVLGLCAVVMADKGALAAIILLLTISIFVIAVAKYLSEWLILKQHINSDKKTLKPVKKSVNTGGKSIWKISKK